METALLIGTSGFAGKSLVNGLLAEVCPGSLSGA